MGHNPTKQTPRDRGVRNLKAWLQKVDVTEGKALTLPKPIARDLGITHVVVRNGVVYPKDGTRPVTSLTD